MTLVVPYPWHLFPYPSIQYFVHFEGINTFWLGQSALWMFGSYGSFVLWIVGKLSLKWIFGEGNDGETNFLRVSFHKGLANLNSVLQLNPLPKCLMSQQTENRIFFWHILMYLVTSYLKESILWCFAMDNGERLPTVYRGTQRKWNKAKYSITSSTCY